MVYARQNKKYGAFRKVFVLPDPSDRQIDINI